MADPAVSVVIPTYNRAHCVAQALESVFAQSFTNLEIIVVDDASTDNTEAVVRTFGDPRLCYLRLQVNAGPSAARNRGIAEARGEYIAFLDSDDRWFPSKLQKQVDILQRAPASVGYVCTGLRHVTRAGTVSLVWMPQHRGHLFPRSLVEDVRGAPSTMLIRRPVLDEVGAWDATLSSVEDWDMGVRISRVCAVDFVPEVLVDLVVDGQDRLSANAPIRQQAMLALWKKYRDVVRMQPRQIRARYYRNEAVAAWHHRLPGASLEFMIRSLMLDPRYGFEYGWRAIKKIDFQLLSQRG